MQLEVKVALVKVGPRYLAFTEVGGMKLRGESATRPAGAVRNLFFTLSGNGPRNDDAEIAVDLLVAGTNLEAELNRELGTPALTDGREQEVEDPFAESGSAGTGRT